MSRSWTLLEHASGLHLRRLRWDGPYDGKRLVGDPLLGLQAGFHTAPSILVDDVSSVPCDLRDELPRLSVPLLSRGSVGLDGWKCGVELPGFNSYILEWFMGGPEEWRTLDEWHQSAMKRLDEWCEQ